MEDKALTVRCPKCNAPAGQKCRDQFGNPAPGVLIHKARVTTWRKARGL